MAQKTQIFEISTTHKSTAKQIADHKSKGLYYNSSYEIENFIQVVQDNTKGDPFKVLNDATFTRFKLFFHFDAKSGLLADEDNVNSALAFFKRIGDTTRYDLLIRFITALSKVNSIAPWIFQEISDLSEVYSLLFDEPRKMYDIEIKTLETIDTKIMSLVEMHRLIVYDFNRKVWVLPENLRRFGMSVYVYDSRIFDNTSDTSRDFLQTINNTDIRNLNHMMFDFLNCQFTTKSGMSYFSNINNNNSTMSENNLTISVSKVEISSLFKTITGDSVLHPLGFDFIQQSNVNGVSRDKTVHKFLSKGDNKQFLQNTVARLSNSQLVQSVQERANEYTNLINGGWETQLRNVRDEITERAIQNVEGRLSKLYLGNVHGFGFDDLLRLSQDNDFRTSFNQMYSQQSTTRSLSLGNTERKTLGKV